MVLAGVLVLTVAGTSAAGSEAVSDEGLVRNPYVAVLPSWRPHAFMGSDFRLLLSGANFLERVGGGALFRDNLSLRESAWEFGGDPPGTPDYVRGGTGRPFYHHPVPAAERRNRPYRLEDAIRDPRIADDSFTNRPFFLSLHDARPAYWLQGESPLADRKAFRAWCAKHPNFIGFQGFDELDSDGERFAEYLKSDKPADAETQRRFRARYPQREKGTGLPFRDWIATSHPANVAYYFGSSNIWPLASNSAAYLPICASLGAKGLFYEATTQSHGPWALGGAYLRGSARQWAIPYVWYGANWYGGVPRTDLMKWPQGENLWCCTNGTALAGEPRHGGASDIFRPHRGASRSILERQAVYGWLIGASFYCPEHWNWLYIAERDGHHVLSDEGEDIETFYRLAKRVDRGVPYTPLAVLTPVDEPVWTTSWGEGLRDAFTQQAVFQTLIPLNCPSPSRILNRRGDQGCLYNSEFGELFDVLQPDAGQRRSDLVRTLSAYPCAILAGGGFRNETLDRAALEQYVLNGGTLIVSADQIDRGFVSPELAGVTFGKDARADATSIDDGRTLVFLTDRYAVRKARPTTARACVWTDYDDRLPVVYANDVGRGRVLSVACDRFMPKYYADGNGEKNDYHWEYVRISSGQQRFALLQYLFAKVRDETLPVSVRGDVQWGVNRTATGWLVWFFNNKGVLKYTDEPEAFDMSKTAYVTLDLKRLTPRRVTDPRSGEELPTQGMLPFTLAPGRWRFIEITETTAADARSAKHEARGTGKREYGDVRGFDFQPPWASNGRDIWLKFNAAEYRRIVRLARQAFPGLNTLRVWYSFDAWYDGREKAIANMREAAEIIASEGLRMIPVYFNAWRACPDFGGLSHEQLGGAEKRDWQPFRRYLKELAQALEPTGAVLMNDLCNEPLNNTLCADEGFRQMRDFLFAMSAEIRKWSRRPVTISSQGFEFERPMLGCRNDFELFNGAVDVFSIHPYAVCMAPVEHHLDYVRDRVAAADALGKPVIVTECCWDADGDEARAALVELELGNYEKLGLGFIAHALTPSMVADLHPKDGVNPGFYMHFMDLQGRIRSGHDAFNRHAPGEWRGLSW